MREAERREAGFTLVLVVLIGGVIGLLLAIMARRSVDELEHVHSSRRWDQALHVAESGVEHTLFQLSRDVSYHTSGDKPSDRHLLPPEASTWDRQAERRWVLATAARVDGDTARADRTGSTPEGDWVVIKPEFARVVYGVSYIPTRTSPAATRVLKVTYDFLWRHHELDLAVLVDGDLSLPDAGLRLTGGVHANGAMSIISTAHKVKPPITATSCSSPCEVAPPIAVPRVDPRHHYAESMYDLCDKGVVRKGPAYPGPGANRTGTPCVGEVLDAVSLGWSFSGQTWQDTSSSAPGVYYVYGADLLLSQRGSKSAPWPASFLVDGNRTRADDCKHGRGNVTVKGAYLVGHPSLRPFVIVGGRDVTIIAKLVERGVVYAWEQIDLQGGPDFRETNFIAYDACDSPGSPASANVFQGAVDIKGVEDVPVPEVSGIRQVGWLEL